MTQQEALVEARRRFGDDAPHKFGFAIQYNPHLYSVGQLIDGEKSFEHPIIGEGNSWEAAFADADRRETS